MPALFNRARINAHHHAAAMRFHDHDFLFDHVWHDVADRLDDIKQNFDRVLIVGPRGGDAVIADLQARGKITGQVDRCIVPETEMLDVVPGTYDLVLCVGELHLINDLKTFLLQLRLALAPGGVMIAAAASGDTLHELRASLMQADMDTRGGMAPRVHPFLDRQQWAVAMQESGLNLPVVDTDTICVEYTDLSALLKDLRGMGGGNALIMRHKGIPPRTFFTCAGDHYAAHFQTDTGRLVATFEITYLIGWAG